MYRSESGLFYALEKVLRGASEPLTCHQIFDDNAEIRTLAKTANRVSDYLGNLWRKGAVSRVPAPSMPNSSARWAYTWNERNKAAAHDEQAQDFVKSFSGDTPVFRKANLEIFDNGRTVKIELPNFTITIAKR